MKKLRWNKLALNMAALAVESNFVIAMRLAKLARGGKAADQESKLMVSEKIAAATQASVKAATGGSPNAIVGDYRKKVRANARRLSRLS